MSSMGEENVSELSSPQIDKGGGTDAVEDIKAKLNGMSGDSVLKENGVENHKSEKSSSSSHKSGEKHHSSSHKSSSSDKHKHHSSSSSSSKHRDGHSSSSSKDKDGHRSSSSKHRDGHSSSSSKDKDGHRSSSSKHRDGSSSSSSKHRDGHSSSSSSKHKDGSSSSKHSSSSSHRDEKGSSSSKHSSSSKSHSSSSSSSKHRDGHSSSSSSSKHREGSSSSSKDKSSSSSSSHDKHREKSKDSSSRDKHKSSSSKHKDDQQRSSSKLNEDGKENIKSPSNTETVDEIKVEPLFKEEVKEEAQEEYKADIVNDVNSNNVTTVDDEEESEEDDDTPLSVRIKGSENLKSNKRIKEEVDYGEDDDDDDDEEEDIPLSARASKAKKIKLEKTIKTEKLEPIPEKKTPVKKNVKKEKNIKQETSEPPKKKKKGAEEEEKEVWKWWEEEKVDNGVKWTFLQHKGPVFAPLYEPLPKHVHFYYDGKPMQLEPDTEEVATFYGKMLDHDYTTKDVFNNNFWKDWRKVMTLEEKQTIKDFEKCNFTEINEHFKKVSEERKNRSKEEKQIAKKEAEELVKEYGVCLIDKHSEKIGNFRIEPPGLFRGRGDHPKQGQHKHRTMPEEVIINCSKDSVIPKPPEGHKWKEVRHDNTVTWLASWTENIQGATKYVMLNAASKLKGEKDMMKYETARKLHKCVDKIRAQYQDDWKSKEMKIRQRAVALYFIDKLALRAGNEKDSDEAADTVGCCSLRVEHITLCPEKDGKNYVVEFDFLGKDSIRYQNAMPVEKRVFKNLELFMENKAGEDDLFDRLNTTVLNKHLQELMEGLTAKVFRTYNASRTLSEQLELLTNEEDGVAAKILSYNRANRAVAILCNHQRAVPKTFEKSMENLQKKIDSKKDDIKQVKKDIKGIKAEYKQQKSVKTKTMYEKKKKTLARLEDQLVKLEVQATDKDENKEIALGTSKLNYLDPRISVAWCKKFDVPIEKVYNKTQRDKFKWAIEMATEHFKF